MAAVANPSAVPCSIAGVKEIYLLQASAADEVIFLFSSVKARQAVASVFKEKLKLNDVTYRPIAGGESFIQGATAQVCYAFAVIGHKGSECSLENFVTPLIKVISEKVSPEEKPKEFVLTLISPPP